VPTLLVIAGPNGGGKSTLTAETTPEGLQNLIDPDAIARRVNPANPTQSAAEAGRIAIARTRQYLADKTGFAVETTLSGKGTLATIRQAKAAGFDVHLLYVALDTAELHIQRVRLRAARGGHDVPDDDVRRRYVRSLANLPEALRLSDKAVVFDNSGASRRRILIVRDGSIIWCAPDLPDWVRDIERTFAIV
jgi:predicted ABC-type ATPase